MSMYRVVISRVLSQIPEIEVVGEVAHGRKALAFLDEHEVDLVTLDVEMPIMDGLDTLREIRRTHPHVDVVMVSALSDQAARLTIKCLQMGAVDFVLKPQGDSFIENQRALSDKFRDIVANLGTPKRTGSRTRPAAPSPKPEPRPKPPRAPLLSPKIILIGISTGGPKVLTEVFDHLNVKLKVPILIVQHMPPKFTTSLAMSLNSRGPVPVMEAEHEMIVEPGNTYIAPGGYHMLLERQDKSLRLLLNTDPPVNSCRPAVDVLFDSAVSLFRRGDVVAMVLTGMGRDGADGARRLHEAGAYVAIQSEATCTVFGMPKAVHDLGIQHEILDVEQIAPFIVRLAKA